jgi:acyl-coenzyme A thioesterase PaaI-like protein
MDTREPIDISRLLAGEERAYEAYLLPPPIFASMQCDIVAYQAEAKSLTARMPLLREWLNPFSTMQGGMIMAAVDNAVGPLSMLVSTPSWTRTMESKYLKPIRYGLDFIYVTAVLVEEKRGRLIFEVEVADAEGTVYTTAKVTNWLMKDTDAKTDQ